MTQDLCWKKTFDFIQQIYNNALENQADVRAEFAKLESLAKSKGIKFFSVFSQIGNALNRGELPTMQQLWWASHILSLKEAV